MLDYTATGLGKDSAAVMSREKRWKHQWVCIRVILGSVADEQPEATLTDGEVRNWPTSPSPYFYNNSDQSDHKDATDDRESITRDRIAVARHKGGI